MEKKIDLTPTIYEYQVAACEDFFKEQLPGDRIKPLGEKEIPPSLEKFTGSVFDITGFDAQEVVGLLSYIVNARDKYKTNKTFYLLIKGEKNNDEFEEVFKLKARPTELQPGNGIVFLRPKGKKKFKQSAKAYEELNGMLEADYDTDTSSLAKHAKLFDTRSFADDIKLVFKNNVHIGDEEFPRATTEVYMIWLFEIARRLVKSEKPSSQQLDVLPIGSAIAGLVRLLEFGDGEKCNFEDVFLPGKKFHCFTGKPEERKNAVHQINKAVGVTTNKPSMQHYIRELEQLFVSEKRYEDQLAQSFQNLMQQIPEATDRVWSEEEEFSAFNSTEN